MPEMFTEPYFSCNFVANSLNFISNFKKILNLNDKVVNHNSCLYLSYFYFLCGNVLTLFAQFADIVFRLLNNCFHNQCATMCLNLFVTKVSAN